MAEQKWNLGDIRPPERGTKGRRRRVPPQASEAARPPRVDASTLDEHEPTEEPRPMRRRSGSMKKKLYLGAGIIGVLLVVLLLVSVFTRGAEVTVYPKHQEVPVQATFTAYQDPEVGQLGYELLTLEEEGERTVAATGEEEATERATGMITIHNEYSDEPQRLIKNTRFATEEGLIFRISESVVVPGYTTGPDDAINPGTLTTEVFADAPGDSYNIGPSAFTIPGLEGTEQYEGMYARSTAPMTGGFEGMRLIVEEQQLSEAQNAIRTELESSLRTRLQNERPAGFVLYEDAARVRFESLPAIEAGEGQATVREKAVLEAPIFAETDFAQYLAQNTIAGYEGEPVRIDNPHALSFAYIPATTTEQTAAAASIDFNLTGDALIVWDYDENQLRTDLAGAAKTALQTVLSGYPAIERSEATIRPVWKRSFPEDVEDISIIEVLE